MRSSKFKKIKSAFKKLLKFQKLPKKIAAYANIEGWLQEREAITLFRYASKLKSSAVIVEIGSWKGKSTFCLAQGLRSGKVCAIDPFNAAGDAFSMKIYDEKKGEKDLLLQFQERIRELNVENKIEILKGYSTDFQ